MLRCVCLPFEKNGQWERACLERRGGDWRRIGCVGDLSHKKSVRLKRCASAALFSVVVAAHITELLMRSENIKIRRRKSFSHNE